MTWSELSSEWGELSSECGANCLGASFQWSELSNGELSLGQVVLFPGLRPMQSKKPDPSRALQLQLYLNARVFFSSNCHISRPFHKHLNTFVWLLFKN